MVVFYEDLCSKRRPLKRTFSLIVVEERSSSEFERSFLNQGKDFSS